MNFTDLMFAPMVNPAVIVAIIGFAIIAVAVRCARSGPHILIGWLPRIAVLLLLGTVLLRPSVLGQTAAAEPTNADVFIVVDTTASMGATDWNGGEQRLNGVRVDVSSLVEQLAGARFAVISFDSVATVRVPLTSDAAAVITAMTVAQPEVSGYSAGSSVGNAAPLLTTELQAAALDAPQRARIVYYFGDGEQTSASAPESFAQSAALIGGGAVFAYGTSVGATMPINAGRGEDSPGVIIDPATGAPALSVMNTGTLEVIAEQLAVPLDVRDAATPVEPGPLSHSSLTFDGSLERRAVNELYWVPAIGAIALLAVELARLVFITAHNRPRRGRA